MAIFTGAVEATLIRCMTLPRVAQPVGTSAVNLASFTMFYLCHPVSQNLAHVLAKLFQVASCRFSFLGSSYAVLRSYQLYNYTQLPHGPNSQVKTVRQVLARVSAGTQTLPLANQLRSSSATTYGSATKTGSATKAT